MFPVINRYDTGANIRRLMDMRGITPKDVQQYLNLGCVQSVYRWFDGVNVPTIDNLYALSELFQVPIDEIVCGNRAPIIKDISFARKYEQFRRVYAYYKKLSEKGVA